MKSKSHCISLLTFIFMISYSNIYANGNEHSQISENSEVKEPWSEHLESVPDSKIDFNVFKFDPNDLNNERLLVVNPMSGFGNRLKALASAYAIAKITRRKLILDWTKEPSMPAYFSELFSSPKIVGFNEMSQFTDPVPSRDSCRYDLYQSFDSRTITHKPMLIVENNELYSYAKIDNYVQRLLVDIRKIDPDKKYNMHWLYTFKETNQKNFRLEWNRCDLFIRAGAHGPNDARISLYMNGTKRMEEIEHDRSRIVYLKSWDRFVPVTSVKIFENEYLNFFKHLVPKKNVIDTVNEFYEKNLKGHKVIAVHFRSWNPNVENNNILKLPKAPLEEFFSKMQEAVNDDPEVIFFVCGDDIEAIEKMKARFGKRVVSFSKKQVTRNSLEDIHLSLVDWYLLQRSMYIIGTNQSTFSDEAARFTKQKRKVSVGPKIY